MPELDDMAAAIAAATEMEAEETADAAKPTTEAAPDASADDSAADDLDPAASDDLADDGADNDGPAADDDADGSVPDLSAIGQQFVDGDLAGACKALGIDPKILNVNVPKFEAMRKGLKETRARETSALTAETAAKAAQTRADAVMADAKSKYGDLVDLKLSVKAGDFYAVREILEALAPDGTPIQKILEGIALAAKNVNPSEIAYKRKLRELAVKEQADKDAKAAETAAATTKAEETARAERNRAGAAKALKGSPFDGIPGAIEALVKLAAENWDPVKNGLKVPKEQLVKMLAKDPVLGGLAELKRLKDKPAPAATAPVNKNKIRNSSGQFQRPAKGPTKQEQMEADRKASITEAARLEARDARAKRGAR